MPLFTASARAQSDDGCGDVMQMVVAAYHRDHAIILLTDAIERHNHRTRWWQKLPMFELMRARIFERPENRVLTPARGPPTSATPTSTARSPTPACTATR